MDTPPPNLANGIEAAARALKAGGLVILPTETVYGLAADAADPRAVAAVYEAKGRPSFNPLIAHVADLAAARAIARFDDRAERLAQARAAFLPTLTSGFQRNVQQAPPSSIFLGSSGTRTDNWSGNVGLGQRLRWGGGSYSFGWNSLRSSASSSLCSAA